MKRLFFCGLIAVIGISITAFDNAPLTPAKKDRIKWLTMEEAYALAQKTPKKIIVDVYTNWCGWCKVMDRETYQNKKVAAFINENFYPVKLNAEQRGEIKLGNQKFRFIAQGGRGVHELALNLLQTQRPSYPATVFLDEQLNVIEPVAGYLKADEFHKILTYFAGNYYKKGPYDKFTEDVYPSVVKSDKLKVNSDK